MASTKSSKIVDLETALSAVEDGMIVGIGGWIFHGQPMALIRGLVRRGVRNLTLVPAPGSVAPDMLIRASPRRHSQRRHSRLRWGIGFWHCAAVLGASGEIGMAPGRFDITNNMVSPSGVNINPEHIAATLLASATPSLEPK